MIWALIGIGLFLFVLGGVVTSVRGIWRDGQNSIVLTQWGPRVAGVSQRPGGLQRYRGWLWLGFLRLHRYDEGTRHLENMGFSADRIPLVQGRPMARLRLRLRGDTLAGTFEGYEFDFTDGPTRLVSSFPTNPQPRRWDRE